MIDYNKTHKNNTLKAAAFVVLFLASNTLTAAPFSSSGMPILVSSSGRVLSAEQIEKISKASLQERNSTATGFEFSQPAGPTKKRSNSPSDYKTTLANTIKLLSQKLVNKQNGPRVLKPIIYLLRQMLVSSQPPPNELVQQITKNILNNIESNEESLIQIFGFIHNKLYKKVPPDIFSKLILNAAQNPDSATLIDVFKLLSKLLDLNNMHPKYVSFILGKATIQPSQNLLDALIIIEQSFTNDFTITENFGVFLYLIERTITFASSTNQNPILLAENLSALCRIDIHLVKTLAHIMISNSRLILVVKALRNLHAKSPVILEQDDKNIEEIIEMLAKTTNPEETINNILDPDQGIFDLKEITTRLNEISTHDILEKQRQKQIKQDHKQN